MVSSTVYILNGTALGTLTPPPFPGVPPLRRAAPDLPGGHRHHEPGPGAPAERAQTGGEGRARVAHHFARNTALEVSNTDGCGGFHTGLIRFL